ncbi:hypothetical protein TI24_13060 [Vibrio vulnificus]|uniref:Uncharacterized protein n=1 Tax=Vibrio vulnificus TaxID=672 RepID=A0A6S4Q1E8_VIBVL|nr:hypothetical protein VVCECT4999_07090 [Vibrio vulnificus]KGK68568.1 hypothetical protein NA76_20335 [Vibrio vulnificus]PNG70041.1 hypothetical protein TI24_13060 [Vibrio vulnificus]PNG75999.1 hypothetical protein TI31_14265 [Vibrio vulnificus]POB73736.1 hypothetical protein CRN62_08990 [Vibrio vulnificus]
MGAKSSESCFIEIQSVGEVSEVILISKLKPSFSISHVKIQSWHNQIYDLIQLFSAWFWFVKVSRVKLLVSQT